MRLHSLEEELQPTIELILASQLLFLYDKGRHCITNLRTMFIDKGTLKRVPYTFDAASRILEKCPAHEAGHFFFGRFLAVPRA